jgi:hypothetical protein
MNFAPALPQFVPTNAETQRSPSDAELICAETAARVACREKRFPFASLRVLRVSAFIPLPQFWPRTRLALLITTALTLAGCSKPVAPTEPTPPPALTAEVQQAAVQRGKAIAAETFGLLSSNLQTALQSGGVSNALPFCALTASPLTTGIAAKHGVTLKRVTHQARNPAAKASATELAVLQSFASALTASTNPPPPFATNLIAGQATFFAPIVIANELCLKCHGEPGKDISAENLAIIQQHYPQDEATGFKLGQLRGAWRIDFPLATLPTSRSATVLKASRSNFAVATRMEESEALLRSDVAAAGLRHNRAPVQGFQVPTWLGRNFTPTLQTK